jgi:hypothetical protein
MSTQRNQSNRHRDYARSYPRHAAILTQLRRLVTDGELENCSGLPVWRGLALIPAMTAADLAEQAEYVAGIVRADLARTIQGPRGFADQRRARILDLLNVAAVVMLGDMRADAAKAAQQ